MEDMTLEDLVERLRLIEAVLHESFTFDLVSDRDFALSEIARVADEMAGRRPRQRQPRREYA
jgi:hypothetical protein